MTVRPFHGIATGLVYTQTFDCIVYISGMRLWKGRPGGSSYLVKAVWDFTSRKNVVTGKRSCEQSLTQGPTPNSRATATRAVKPNHNHSPSLSPSDCIHSSIYQLPWYWLSNNVSPYVIIAAATCLMPWCVVPTYVHAFIGGTQCVTLYACHCTWVTFNAICCVGF